MDGLDFSIKVKGWESSLFRELVYRLEPIGVYLWCGQTLGVFNPLRDISDGWMDAQKSKANLLLWTLGRGLEGMYGWE